MHAVISASLLDKFEDVSKIHDTSNIANSFLTTIMNDKS